MKNNSTNTGADLRLSLPVPDGTKVGEPTIIGDGLLVVPTMPKTTQDLLNQGANVGHPVGNADCIVRGKTLVQFLPIVGAIGVLAKVFKAGDGTYTATSTNNTLVGHSITALTTDGVAEVIIL